MAAESDDIGLNCALEKEKEDPSTKEWCKLIDLDTVIEPKLDWQSTRTFELFLDALDVNQYVIKNDKTSCTQKKENTKKVSSVDGANDKIETGTAGQTIGSEQRLPSLGSIKNVDTYHGVETILSAEALKILSELPDLSHMSSTRSFIFPSYNTVRK